MRTSPERRTWRPSGRRLCAALSTMAITVTAAGVAAPATAQLVPGEPIAADRNITVFHNIDFVAISGFPASSTTVEVLRKGVLIGTATGVPADGGEGLAMEVNHGPEGDPVPGDCWEGHTPDIRPGDKIEVTHAEGTSSVVVDNITFSGPAFEQNPVRGENHNILVKGVAKRANGANIPIAFLDSAEFRDTSKYRGTPHRVMRDPAVDGGFIMVYRPPYLLPDGRNRIYPRIAQRKRSLLTSGGHATGFGHVEVLPRESMLVDGLDDVPGPALGCNDSPAAVDAVTSSNRAVLRHGAFATPGADLVLRGKAFESTAVSVRVGNPARGGLTKAATVAGGAWSATIPMRQLRNLPEGDVQVSMTSTRDAGVVAGVAKTLVMDRITAPVKPRSLRATAGNHSAKLTWARSAFNGNSAITGYRLHIIRNGAVTRSVKVGNVRTATVRRLANNRPYRFRVSAFNKIGSSAMSVRSNRVVPRR